MLPLNNEHRPRLETKKYHNCDICASYAEDAVMITIIIINNKITCVPRASTDDDGQTDSPAANFSDIITRIGATPDAASFYSRRHC